ncbi:histidine kinase [Hungatella sp.]|uniref:sensor histidine kinase n=1 Tax=Hungatella sp. TaxID=2613924 RepID=UPI002A7EF801|nr:histidine kinase [Hungatella sp.]
MKLPYNRFSFIDLKLKHKLVLIIIIVAATITGFTLFGFTYVINQYNKLLYGQTANSLSFVSDELMYQLESIEAISSYITYSTAFQENLSVCNTTESSPLPAQKAKNEIVSIFNQYYTPDMIHLTVLTANGRNIWWGKSIYSETEAKTKNLLDACDKASGRIVWHPSEKGSRLLCARKILEVKNLSLIPMGYMIIEIDLEDMVHNLLKSRYANGQQFELFISNDERLIYPSDHENYINHYKDLFSASQSYAIKNIDGMRMFITSTKLPIENGIWHMSLAVPYDKIFRSLNRLIPVFVFSLILSIYIAAILAGRIIKNISYQFNILVEKMDRIKMEGIMKPQTAPLPSTNSQDEMTILNSAFDQMIVELKKLIENSYVNELLITQAKLKSLEQQVNPHFLYNTLNSINWIAKKAGVKDISTIVQSLGSILQSTLNKKTITSIEEELTIVSCYVKIQQIRFDDLIIDMNIDSSTIDAEIPKMTIQPLVENAILHSQEEPQEEYLIRLSVTRENENLIKVQVENSGSFIDTKILEHLKENIVTPKGNGVGLLNIDSRLRIIFGDDYHLNFDNKNGMAIVSFTIPQKTDLSSSIL